MKPHIVQTTASSEIPSAVGCTMCVLQEQLILSEFASSYQQQKFKIKTQPLHTVGCCINVCFGLYNVRLPLYIFFFFNFFVPTTHTKNMDD